MVKLKTEYKSVQLYNHIGKSPQNADPVTVYTTYFKTKQPDITLRTTIKFKWFQTKCTTR